MNHNQRPWCHCHNEKTLHYFFRETSPDRKGRTRKQLMTACHECGSPGNQAVKKTPEMRRRWLDSLPVLSMDAYYEERYGWTAELRPYTIGSQLNRMERPLHQHIARVRKDRRTEYGIWFLYEENYTGPNKFWHDPFGEVWSMIKYGHLKFPKDAVDHRDLFHLGSRRAEHATHPHTLEPIFENPDARDLWYEPQFYYRRDLDTKYVSYLVCILFNEDYLVKIELDLDHIFNTEIKETLRTLPEWTGKELPLTPAEEIAEVSENSEAEYLDELKEDACAAAGTGEFAMWHFDPELGDEEWKP